MRFSFPVRRIQDGVLIDFSRMKAFSYNPTRDTITIEPGVLWREVYDGLQAQGVAPVGGRVACAIVPISIEIPSKTEFFE